MSERKTRGKKSSAATPPLAPHSLSLGRQEELTLGRLSQDASDFVGRKVSGSAVVRALLRFADRQGESMVSPFA
jgi:hypothetical protein